MYHVDFGDGASSTTTSSQTSHVVPHVYQTGAFPVSVRVERQGLTVTATTTVRVAIGPRTRQDRPDEASGLQIKIVYLNSADGPDRGLDTTGVLHNSVGSFQSWFTSKTGKLQRQDTYQGKLDIVYFKSLKTNAEIAARGAFVVTELYGQLREAGFNDPNKRYLIYYNGTSTYACGGALVDGQAAAMYLRAVLSSGASCLGQSFAPANAPPGYWEFAMLHDSFHIGGIVDRFAPNHYNPNPYHVNDIADLMHNGLGGWSPTVVDSTTRNYYGDNVPAGVRNLRNDPILIPAPASAMASAIHQMRAWRGSPQAPIPYHLHEVVRQRPSQSR